MAEKLLVPIYLPRWMSSAVLKMKRTFIPSRDQQSAGALDLTGDRNIEWSFIASRLPAGQGYVFDFGCSDGSMAIHAVQKGHRVLALDLLPSHFPWSHPNVEIICGDLLKLDLPQHSFDFILNCSTVEHVGLSGRYGVSFEETDGDLKAMRKLRQLLKPSGKMLMTVPCGLDAVIAPWHRVYGKQRLPVLLSGYETEEEVYWMKRADNRWYVADREGALSYAPTSHPTRAVACSYALGCFALRGS
jgi:SAM-dependent methyltransferase